MTDPLNPNHDEPAEGPRSADYTGDTAADRAKDLDLRAAAVLLAGAAVDPGGAAVELDVVQSELLLRNEVPRSPRSTPPSHSPYWT